MDRKLCHMRAIDHSASVARQGSCGLRAAWTRGKVYVAALYLPQKKETLKDIIALPGAKRVAVVMLREVSSDDLGEAMITGIHMNSTPEETRRFGLPLIKMGDIFSKLPKLKKGESFSVDWVPGSGDGGSRRWQANGRADPGRSVLRRDPEDLAGRRSRGRQPQAGDAGDEVGAPRTFPPNFTLNFSLDLELTLAG
ncbi:MAG: chalcone isomerase family protein [Burkholderiaceae bacterium]